MHMLDTREHAALLQIYSLDTRLGNAQTRIATLSARRAALLRERGMLVQQLHATQQTLAASRRELGDSLSTLYKQDDVNTLAVVLGSRSLDDAVTRIDDLNRFADQGRRYVETTSDAQARLERLLAAVKEEDDSLRAGVADARATAAALTSLREERDAYLARLRKERTVAAAQIRSAQRLAVRAAHRSATLQAAAAAAAPTTAAPPAAAPGTAGPPPAPAPATAAGRTITVTATGYSLGGRTSTGVPVGPGVVAVDPAVIPLGTRLTVPGYGRAVAADTGGSVRGNTIDLWFPTLAQARAWGRRTVAVTLH